MEVTDLVLEVRNPSKIRVGQIMPHYWVDVTLNPVFNGVGIWSVTLPNEHPLVAVLKTPGSGIVATGPEWVVSGPMVEAIENASPADAFGTWTFSGYTDEIVLDDPLAFPDPTVADIASQPDGYDTRTGNSETLCHAYVNANIGPGAPTARRNPSLVMGVDGGRGGVRTYSAAFEKLIEVLQHLTCICGLGFRVYQVNDNIVYENYAIVDRTDQIRLDFDNGTLDSTEFGYSSPKATHAVIASVDEEGNRLFHGYSNATSEASSTEWGRRIERFIERKSAQDTAELNQIGNELMVNEGVTITSLKVTPSDQSSMRFGLDWYLGDRVSVTVGTQVVEVVVTEAVITANSGGVSVAVRIGDANGFDFESAIHSRVSKLEQRVSVQERESTPVAVLERIATLETEVDALQVPYTYRQTVYFTSSGTFTKASYPWLRAMRVRVVGGGGGGAGAGAAAANQHAAGSGGGGGGYAESFITNISGLASSVPVTVGAGGAGGVGNNDGSAGGASSFGSLVVAEGGDFGETSGSTGLAIAPRGGAGGMGTTGDLKLRGGPGGSASGYATLGSGGHGGNSQLGGGAEGSYTSAGSSGVAGGVGGNYGGGGGGAMTTAGGSARNGGAGGPGVVIVELYS